MDSKKTLHVLGCVPYLLNILFELAEDSEGFHSFRILKNIPVDMGGFFTPQDEWAVDNLEYYKGETVIDPKGPFAFSVTGPDSKVKVHQYFRERIGMADQQFTNLVHPKSYISQSAKLGHGLQVEPLSTIMARTIIGFGVNIKRNCNVGHHCLLGDYVTINPGVTMSGFVTVGKNTMIGSGASIKDKISIGSNCIIGVGSVVVKDIPDNSIAYGNPCVVHRLMSPSGDQHE